MRANENKRNADRTGGLRRCGAFYRKVIVGILLIGLFTPVSSVLAYEELDSVHGGSILGKVKFSGAAPPRRKLEISKDQDVCGRIEKSEESVIVGKDQGLQNVVVSLVNILKGKRFSHAQPVLDQRDCLYIPHIVLVAPGTPLLILNSDGILHSVHTHSEKNPPFNRAQSKFKKEIQETFLYPESIKLTCDVHSWMSGWIVVMDHPYFSISEEDGSFKLLDIPSGNYTMRLWHETLGVKESSVFVGGDGNVSVEVEFGDE